MGELGFCHSGDVLAHIATAIASDIPADSGMPFVLIRTLHNKLYYGLFFSLKCYLRYFDAQQIFTFISPFLVPFIVFAYWAKFWRKGILFITFLFPLIMIFPLKSLEIGTKIYIFQGFWIFLAITGLIKFVKMRYFKAS